MIGSASPWAVLVSMKMVLEDSEQKCFRTDLEQKCCYFNVTNDEQFFNKFVSK